RGSCLISHEPGKADSPYQLVCLRTHQRLYQIYILPAPPVPAGIATGRRRLPCDVVTIAEGSSHEPTVQSARRSAASMDTNRPGPTRQVKDRLAVAIGAAAQWLLGRVADIPQEIHKVSRFA